MKLTCAAAVLAAFSLALAAAPAFAQDDSSKPVSVTIDNYATANNDGVLTTNHEIDVVVEGTSGDWTFGADVWAGLTYDTDSDDLALETPTVMLYLKSEAFGELDLWDASGALSNACITPSAGSTHFGNEDLLTFGTCGGYSGQFLTYISPTLDNGFGFQASVMKDLEGNSEEGDVDSSVSAALTYTGTADGLDINASLGVDVATSVNGGLGKGQNLPATVQGGITFGWDGWTLGAAAQYEFNSLGGGNSWGAGIGLGKAVTDALTISAELAADGYEDSGVKYTEVSAGIAADYILNDNTTLDAAINAVHVTGDDDSDSTSAQVGFGISFAF